MEQKPVVTLSMEGDMHTNWKLFKRKLLSYIDAYFSAAQDKQKIGILLHHGGDYCQDVYETFQCKPEDTFTTVIGKFDAHFIPKTNITYERYKIFTLKQSKDETFEQYVTALKRISQGCNFGTLQDELVRDLFICGINNPNLKRQLLGMGGLTLEKALEVCRNFAVVEGQITQIEKANECSVKKEMEIDMMKKKSLENRPKPECQYCGYKHEYGRCPAFGKTCAICKRKNHYARKCMNRKVNL